MKTIIVITYKSGLMRYIPKGKHALEHIVLHFDSITELQEIEIDEEFCTKISILNVDQKQEGND